jgi:Flp pilus assembly protein TadG
MVPLIMIMFGLIQYGLYFWALQGGADIARSAARVAAVSDTNYQHCPAFTSYINNQINTFGTTSGSIIHRTYTEATPGTVNVGDTVTVQVEFKSIDLGFPFVPFIKGGWVAQRAQARVDFVPAQPDTC